MITRFAPAPTGWLHLGHVLNAEYVWGALLRGVPDPRGHQPRVLLRIEDHDRERCRPEYEAGILDDLDWLGYRPDIFPTDRFRAGRCDGRQSDRGSVYYEALEILRAQGLVYACDCTRRDIEGRVAERGGRGAGCGVRRASGVRRAGSGGLGAGRGVGGAARGEITEGAEIRYDGHCRDRGLALADGTGWRVRMDPGVEPFVDLRLGPQAQDPSEQCGDVLIRDRLGNWTYQFCVSADDDRQGVDLVIRGEDLLASTGRQMRLARLLGRETPAAFLHHALIMKSPDQKLSKSDGDTGVRELRARGWTPDEVKRAAVTSIPSAPSTPRTN
ncbi:MAG: glutamate--tRNA ligase family protein [Vicinamibacterales bacterium]